MIGTTGISIGILLCSHFKPSHDDEYDKFRVLRLQQECVVSEQHFNSYYIMNAADDPQIRLSHLNRQQYSTVAALGTLSSLSGFIIQFVGLRALHWSTTVMQLVATLVMTAVHAWIRRGLARDPIIAAVPSDYEITWLALHAVGLKACGPLVGVFKPATECCQSLDPVMVEEPSKALPEPDYLKLLKNQTKWDAPKPAAERTDVPTISLLSICGELREFLSQKKSTLSTCRPPEYGYTKNLGFL